MTRWYLVLFGLAAYAVALLVNAPAGLLDAGLKSATDGKLRLTEAEGSLWSGAGRLEMRLPSGRALAGQGLRWRLLPGQLLQARLAFAVQMEQGAPAFVLALGARRVEVADADVALPAAALALAEPKLLPLQLTGDVSVHVRRLVVAPEGWTGSATIQWKQAGSALTRVSPLGDYELQLASEGVAAQMSLVTLRGPLRLEGEGGLNRGGLAAFTVVARVDQDVRAQLEPLLRLIAVERGDGSFALQLN